MGEDGGGMRKDRNRTEETRNAKKDRWIRKKEKKPQGGQGENKNKSMKGGNKGVPQSGRS